MVCMGSFGYMVLSVIVLCSERATMEIGCGLFGYWRRFVLLFVLYLRLL